MNHDLDSTITKLEKIAIVIQNRLYLVSALDAHIVGCVGGQEGLDG